MFANDKPSIGAIVHWGFQEASASELTSWLCVLDNEQQVGKTLS